jgi:hypothetical protein
MVHLHVGEKENAQGETLSVRGENAAHRAKTNQPAKGI